MREGGKTTKTVISCVLAITLASVILYLLKSVLPEGHIKSALRFIYGVLLTLLIILPIINIKDTMPQSLTPELPDLGQSMAQGAEIQIRQMKGFKNAQITVGAEDGRIVRVYILAKRSDSGNLIEFEQNKKALVRLMKVLYKLDENMIVIEPDE